MSDITVIYYTANHIDDYFAENIRKNLLKSIGGLPLISVSQKPMGFGKNICVGKLERHNYNIYKQILVGVSAAKTKYVAMAEDDTLYSSDHFTTFRPENDEVAYNKNRWGIYTWVRPPTFSYKDRGITALMIAPRKILIKALNERFEKYKAPDEVPLKFFGEIGKYEKHMGVPEHKRVFFKSKDPCVMFSHEDALGYQGLGRRKRMGDLRCETLEPWGSAEEVLKLWKK